MTKKDYVALARELHVIMQDKSWIACVNAVARVCARDNPRFNVRWFWRACGMSDHDICDCASSHCQSLDT